MLYAGLMITNQGPKVLEYNVRFGDPECQPLLMRLKSDLVDVLEATVDGRLDELGPLEWDPRPAVCVVMAAEGYPGKYAKGQPIRGIGEADLLPDVKVFHAGTAVDAKGRVITCGGRVLGVTALGAHLHRQIERLSGCQSSSAGKAPGAARTSPTRRSSGRRKPWKSADAFCAGHSECSEESPRHFFGQDPSLRSG